MNYQLDPPIDPEYEFDSKLSIEYDNFIKQTCKCSCVEECECMTFEEFKEKYIQEMNDYWDEFDIDEYEEIYG